MADYNGRMGASRVLRWSYLGRVGYAEATLLQQALRDRVRRGTGREHLLLLEHPHVYTLGRSAASSDIVAPPDWLRERGVEVATSNRGGQVTYHGPGQLVGYPIIDLDPDRRDVRRYVRDLQEVLVRTLAEQGVDAHARESPEIGVWVAAAKIASIGVHLSRWITTHGFALNLGTDLEYFQGIVPCGLAGVRMTSVEVVTGVRPELADVATRLAAHFGAVFERQLERAPAASVLAEARPAHDFASATAGLSGW
jgi:lipoyl(octanoyl) transferase